MTNFERWKLYTKNLPCPQSYINYGFMFLIGACLQRRVWYYGEGSEDEGGRLFCNQFAALVGPPGCGKGQILSKISYFLKHHKYEKGAQEKTNTGLEVPGLFPVGADSITFEELLDDIARSTRAFPTPEGKPYIHASYAFVLQELDSLFRKRADDVARFLKNAYDCVPYDRKTKHQGQNLLRRLCLNLISGTQPDFLKEAAEAKIFGQGFASRTLFIFEHDERIDNFHISDLSAEQKTARDELLDWIKRLALVYGELSYSLKTRAFLEDWYHKKYFPQRDACHPRMKDYFSRKKVIMLKLAASIHFGEDLGNTMEVSSFKTAIDFLDSIEPSMAAGLSYSGRNEMNIYTRRLLSLIKTKGSITRRELFLEMATELSFNEIEERIKELEASHGLKTKQELNEKIYYI